MSEGNVHVITDKVLYTRTHNSYVLPGCKGEMHCSPTFQQVSKWVEAEDDIFNLPCLRLVRRVLK